MSVPSYQELPILLPAEQARSHLPGMMVLDDHAEPVIDHPATTYRRPPQQVTPIRDQVATAIKDNVDVCLDVSSPFKT